MEKEISLKEVILALVSFWNYLLSKWKVIVLFGIIGGGIGLLVAITTESEYKAKTSFIIEGQGGGSLNAYAGIASQFGLNLGGSESFYSEENLMELFVSRTILEQTLLKPIKIDGNTEILANRFLELSEKKEESVEDSLISKFSFELNKPLSEYTVLEDSMLFIIIDNIIEENLEVDKKSKLANIIEISCTSTDQVFSRYMVNNLINATLDFYMDHKVGQQRRSIKDLEHRADSVKMELYRVEEAMANWKDSQSNYLSMLGEGSLPFIRLKRENEILNVMYAEIIKNLEFSKVSLANQTPLIKIIDKSRFPLEKIKTRKAKMVVLGGITSGFLIVIFLMIRKVVQNVLKEES